MWTSLNKKGSPQLPVNGWSRCKQHLHSPVMPYNNSISSWICLHVWGLQNEKTLSQNLSRCCFSLHASLLDQFFFFDPVVFESICYRTRGKRLMNEGYMTGGLRKIWTGSCLHRYAYASLCLQSALSFSNFPIAIDFPSYLNASFTKGMLGPTSRPGPAKYYALLRSKWRCSLRLSDGHKRQLLSAWGWLCHHPQNLKWPSNCTDHFELEK